MRRDFALATIIWVAVTVLAELAALNIDFFPLQASAEAQITDEAFDTLLLLGIPVFTFVLVGLIYGVVRYRVSDDNQEDSSTPIRTNTPLTWSWLGITTALAIFVIFNPGIKGIRELTADQNADLVIQVDARKWAWNFSYPELGISIEDADELVLPQNQRIRFEVHSLDIIHSFWVPAFRMKIDAMPGQENVLYVTPTELGSFEDDFNLRVQCAELCGTGHAQMRAGVVVLSQADFEIWAEQQSDN